MPLGDAQDDSAFAIDYIGRKQPFFHPRLSLQSGRGSVTGGAAMPSAGQQGIHGIQPVLAQAGEGQSGSPSDALRALTAADFARRIIDFVPKGSTPPNIPSEGFSLTAGENLAPMLDPSKFSLTAGENLAPMLDPSKFSLGVQPLNTALPNLGADAGRAATEAALEGSSGGSGAVGAVGAAGDAASTLAAALPYLGAALAIGGGGMTLANPNTPDFQKGIAAAEIAAAPLVIANPLIGGLVELGLGLTGFVEGLFDKPGSYGPKRQRAGEEATTALNTLGSTYQAAVGQSPDQILSALASTQGGDRGPVRSAITLPPDVAQQLGLPLRPEWSAFNPAQFTQLLRIARTRDWPSWITGSGDVAYLPREQAEQIASGAANDARQLFRAALEGLPAPAQERPKPTPAMPSSLPMPTETVAALSGPSGALGFAQELLPE